MSRYDLTEFDWRVIAPPAGRDGKKGDRDHYLGHSRDGLTTKIHALVDGRGLLIRLGLTAGQAHDARLADIPRGC